MKNTNIFRIEEHLYENKNHTIRQEYKVFHEPSVYDLKTKSQLTKTEKDWMNTNGIAMVFHF